MSEGFVQSHNERFRITSCMPEAENVDGFNAVVNLIDNPVGSAAADSKKVGTIGRAGEKEKLPRRRPRQDVVFDRDCELGDVAIGDGLTVCGEVGCKLLNINLRFWRETNLKRHVLSCVSPRAQRR